MREKSHPALWGVSLPGQWVSSQIFLCRCSGGLAALIQLCAGDPFIHQPFIVASALFPARMAVAVI
jgi:hypothetical protein